MNAPDNGKVIYLPVSEILQFEENDIERKLLLCGGAKVAALQQKEKYGNKSFCRHKTWACANERGA